jgi:hypothetical protein
MKLSLGGRTVTATLAETLSVGGAPGRGRPNG